MADLRRLRCTDIFHLWNFDAEAMFEPFGEPASVALLAGMDVLETQHAESLTDVVAGDVGESGDEELGLRLQPVYVAEPRDISRQALAEDAERSQLPDEEKRAVTPGNGARPRWFGSGRRVPIPTTRSDP
jgi:hypothetical protein